MAYCSVDDVCSAFPVFQRNRTGNPQDSDIQGWLDDAKAYIRAMFLRRAIDPDSASSFNPPLATPTTDQTNILRMLNRASGIADLAHVLRYTSSSQGQMSGENYAARVPLTPKRFEDGRFSQIEAGLFDKMFNIGAQTLDFTAVMTGSIAGGDQDPTILESETGTYDLFPKNIQY